MTAAAAAILSCRLRLARDMWLAASSFVMAAGEVVTVRKGNGSIYRESENAVTPDRIALLRGWIFPARRFAPASRR